jgi:hypothetical protein
VNHAALLYVDPGQLASNVSAANGRLTRAEGPVGTPQEVTMKQVHDRPVPGWLERLAVATFLAVVGLLMLGPSGRDR